MRKFLAIICFVISSLLILIAVAATVHSLFFSDHRYTDDMAYNFGYVTGIILIPVILLVIAFFLTQQGRKLTISKNEEAEDTDSPSY